MSFLDASPHFHFNGDSTKEESFKKVMGSELANLVLADPPYCLLVRRNKKTGQLRDPKKAKINHEAVQRFENIKEFHAFTYKWMQHAIKYLKDDGIFIVWMNFLGKGPTKKVAKELGLSHFWGEFQWAKLTKDKNANEANARLYEVALIFSKKEKPKTNTNAPWIPTSVVTHYDEEGEAGRWENHPNHKPFSCLEPLIRTYSRPQDRILDPFTGSGSTPAAAIELGRFISGIELRKHWAETTQRRMNDLINQKKTSQ